MLLSSIFMSVAGGIAADVLIDGYGPTRGIGPGRRGERRPRRLAREKPRQPDQGRARIRRWPPSIGPSPVLMLIGGHNWPTVPLINPAVGTFNGLDDSGQVTGF